MRCFLIIIYVDYKKKWGYILINNDKKLREWRESLYEGIEYAEDYFDVKEINDKLTTLYGLFTEDENYNKEYFILKYDSDIEGYIKDGNVKLRLENCSGIEKLMKPLSDNIEVFDYFIYNFNKFYPDLGASGNYPKEILNILMEHKRVEEFYFGENEKHLNYKEIYENSFVYINDVKYRMIDLNIVFGLLEFEKIELGNGDILVVKEEFKGLDEYDFDFNEEEFTFDEE